MQSRTAKLSAYGKLPIARDFLSLRTGGLAGQVIISLLEDGAQSFVSQPSTEASTLLYLTLANGSVALASVRPSADEGGLRAWPFAFYTNLPVDLAASLGPRPFTAITPLIAAMDQAHSQTTELIDAADFERQFGNRHLPLINSSGTTTTAATIPLGAWARTLFDDNEDFALACWRLRLAQRALAAGRTIAGIRLPLAPKFDWAPQADTWLSAIGKRPDSMLVAPSANAGYTLTAFFRSIVSSDLRLLADHRVEGLVDLTTSQSIATLDGFGAFADEVAERSREASLSRLNWIIES